MIRTAAFAAARNPEAQAAREALAARYGDTPAGEADAVVVLGGDGFMLRSLHETGGGAPLYGMNRGSVGFLMNEYKEDELLERLNAAEINALHPLCMTAEDVNGKTSSASAFNEVSLTRSASTAAKLRISIDGRVRMEEIICDGVLAATPAGSTAYNLSAQGPILPMGSELLALTPISAFRPRRWRGAILPETCKISIEVLDPDERPVIAVADFFDVPGARKVEIEMARDKSARLMFDPDHALEERIIREQFLS
ncbi:MAG: NAD kinase [Rhodospirillales bacterium]